MFDQSQTQTAINYYHDLLTTGDQARTTQQLLHEASEANHLKFGTRPICTVLRPCFISSENYRKVHSISSLVMRGLATLGRRMMVDAQLRKELDLTPDEEELINIEFGYGAPDVSARLDGFLSPQGQFHFVEYNAESPGGLGYGHALGEVFASFPIMQQFGQRYNLRTLPIRDKVFDHLVGAYHRWGGKGLPNIAIIDWHGVSTYGEFLIFKSYFEQQGCQVKIGAPEELTLHNGKLYLSDFPIDLVYKRVIIGELISRLGINNPLVQAVRDRAVCMVNAFRVQMLYKKACFALLSDPAYASIYDADVQAALAKHIPWTRKVRESNTSFHDQTIDLVPFIADNKDNLVLKPNGEYGGKGVVLGWECDAETWAATLKMGLAEGYLVQERVELGREVYPSLIDNELRFDERYLDLDPYVWDGEQTEGCGVRLSKLSLLNVTAGGGSATPLFIVDEIK